MADRTPTAREYGGDSGRAAKDPFVFYVKGDKQLDIPDSPQITVHEPDAGTVMDVLDPGTPTRRGLRLLIGPEQWPQVDEHIDRMRIEDVLALAQDIALHFEIDKAFDSGTNRRERRRRARR